MKKLFKLLAYLVAGLVGLLVVAAIALKFFIDPNDYREQISAQASQSAGREINITGDLSLSVFPWLGIELGRVEIGNPAGFSGQFATVQNAGAAVKLLPLLGKDIQINRVLLDGLAADLQVKADGSNNWSGFGASSDSAATPEDADSGVRSLSIAAVDISNSALTLDNAQTGQRLEISEFNLSANGISSGKPFAIDAGLLLNMPRQSSQYQLQLDGQILFDQSSGQWDMDELQLEVTDQSAQPLPPVALSLSGELNTQTEILNLPELELTVDDLTLSGNITGRKVLSDAAFNGSLQLAPFNPKSVAAAFGSALPELADSDVMEDFSGQLQLAMTAQQIQLSELRAKLDDTSLDGDLTVTLGERPNYRFDLNVDQINLDRYLPKRSENAVRSNPQGNAESGVSAIPVETFRALDATGQLALGAVTINNLNASNITVQMQANRSGWRFDPLSADFYKGRFTGAVAIDATGNSPILRTDDNLNQVVAQAMLSDMLGTDFVNGLALFDADLNADLNQPTETLTGEVSFDIRDGSIQGVNIAELLRKGFSIANNLAPGAVNVDEEFLQGGGQTDFASLSGRFIADNGIIRNNDLSMLSPLLRMQGEGMVDLPNNTIDYRITAVLVKTLQGQGGAGLEQLTGKQIPIHITGTLDAPKYGVDPRAILQILAGERIQQQKDKLLEKVGAKLGGEDGAATGLLDSVLSDALGTRTRDPEQAADNQTPQADDDADPADTGTDNPDAAAETEQADDELSTEEKIGGALLNSLFQQQQEDDPPPDEEDGDTGN